MGMSLFKNCTSCTSTSADATAPNPEKFRILRLEQIGSNVLAKIHYVGCTNLEGVKLCVYYNTTCAKIRAAKVLDPHFTGDELSPFARFEPTERGEAVARIFAGSL